MNEICPVCSNKLIMYKKVYTPEICCHECIKCGFTQESRNNSLYRIYKKKKLA